MTFKVSSRRGDTYVHRVPPSILHERGSCRGMDPDIFFGEEANATARDAKRIRNTKKTRAARLICATCPVATECREYGIAAAETYGVWGGLDPWDRAYLLNRQGHLSHPAPPGAPLRKRELPCDVARCSGLVPLGRALVQLSSSGTRYCERCLAQV